MAKKVRDLGSTLELLAELSGQLLEAGMEVEPMVQLSGVYRYVEVGGTVKRPIREGPTMIFHNVKGRLDVSVAIDVLASKKRVVALLDCKPEELGKMFYCGVEKPVLPVMCQGEPVCQQVVHRTGEPDFDLYRLVPAPANMSYGADPYITLDIYYAAYPDIGAHDVTIRRLCIQGRDELSIFFMPGVRHIGAMTKKAEQLGRRLSISINIEVDPTIEIGPCFELPIMPLGYGELSVTGTLRGELVKLCRCLTVDELAIVDAEYVIEGEVVPNVRVKEDQNTHTGFVMLELPGHTEPVSDQRWLVKVKAVTHRAYPTMQTYVGPNEEHVSMAGTPTEASTYGMVEKAVSGRLQNVYCCSAGGGKYMAVLQFKKPAASDKGRQRQTALLAFSAFSELKHIFLVDEDVDCFDMSDVL